MRKLAILFFIVHSIQLHAQNEIQVSSDFPGGNIVVSKISNDTVFITPDLSFTEGEWFYWYFKVSNIKGRTVTFQFDKKNLFAKYGPAYSINNNDSWKWYGGNEVKNNAFTYQFGPKDSVARFSMGFPYTEENLEQFVKELNNKEKLLIDTLCLSPGNRIIEKILIPAASKVPKHKVLITARHHACEMMANYVLEGLIESLLNDINLTYLRDNVEFLIVPFVDKDGVENGEQGKNRIPRDHNRDYVGESVHNSTKAIREFIPEWADGKLEIALDLHCPWIKNEGNEHIYLVGNANPEIESNQLLFSRHLEKYSKGELKYYHNGFLPFGEKWNTSANYTKGKSFSSWANDIDGIGFSATLEFPYANISEVPVSKDGARTFGKAVVFAIQEYLRIQN